MRALALLLAHSGVVGNTSDVGPLLLIQKVGNLAALLALAHVDDARLARGRILIEHGQDAIKLLLASSRLEDEAQIGPIEGGPSNKRISLSQSLFVFWESKKNQNTKRDLCTRRDLMSFSTSGEAVAVHAKMGSDGKSRRIELKSRYELRKSCPHVETQCASSIATPMTKPDRTSIENCFWNLFHKA